MKCTERLFFYENHFLEFYKKQYSKVKEKIQYVFELIQQVEKVPKKFLKDLTGTNGLYIIRVEVKSNIYRIFCCFDEGKLIVLFNSGLATKKSKKEQDKANKLMNTYFKSKKQ